MDQSAINEGNALIAEFLGWPKDDFNYFSPPVKRDRTIFEYDAYSPSNMKFHKDWNWLMMAVEIIELKINEPYLYGGRVVIEAKRCIITQPFIDMVDHTKLSATFKAMIAYIKKHNTL